MPHIHNHQGGLEVNLASPPTIYNNGNKYFKTMIKKIIMSKKKRHTTSKAKKYLEESNMKGKMVVYHQKYQEGNPPVYMGEDAYPYNRNGILIVADGLGGRGGFPHTQLKSFKKYDDRNFLGLDADELCDVILKVLTSGEIGLTVDGIDEHFKDYIKCCFKEILAWREIYINNKEEYDYRNSGYFASRLVTLIASFAINYMPKFNKDTLFQKLSREKHLVVGTTATKDESHALRKYADRLQKVISTKLKEFCDVIGFQHEAKSDSMYLLPSTMMIALTKRNRDKVNVVYLWAGDCRGYVWTKDGMKKVTEDHEEAEIMTNLISCSKDFYIDAKCVRVKVPCLIFNASDGCYKSENYISSMDMELDILQALCANNNVVANETVAKTLCSVYSEKGKHDDSNTISLVQYGNVRDALAKRLGRLVAMRKEIETNAEVFGGSEHYKGVKQERSIAEKGIVEDVLAEHIEYDTMKDAVRKIMIGENYAPYQTALAEIKQDVADEASEALREKYSQRFWRVNKKSIVYKIWQNEETRSALSEEILKQIEEAIALDKEANKAVDEAVGKIEQIIKAYYESYNLFNTEKEED